MPRSERDIVIGKIVAPVGTRGEVKVILLTEFPERFEAGSELTLRLPDGRVQACEGSELRGHTKRARAEARGCRVLVMTPRRCEARSS